MIFKQFIDQASYTYTYILADENSKEAIIIDSVRDHLERDLSFLNENSLKLKYILDTHVHADHITGARYLRAATGAKVCLSDNAKVDSVDIRIKDNDVLEFGAHQLEVIETPGHTDTCCSFLVEDMVFTGDTLLIHRCGRTDFQNGSAEALYESIINKLYTLPDNTKVYPGHDYDGVLHSSIAEEKKLNTRVKPNTTKEEFIETMNNLKLDQPKKIKLSVPANLKLGLSKELNVNEVKEIINNPDYYLIDTRTPAEYDEEHIADSPLIVHSEITQHLEEIPKDKKVILYCRSGRRSMFAQWELEKLGYDNIYNMVGGILAWQEL